MKQALVVGLLIAGLAGPAAVVSGQTTAAAGTSLGNVNIPQRVMADGQPLAAGTYEVRLTGDAPKPVVGQSPDAARYVEFVRNGQVAGREVATVVPSTELNEIAESDQSVESGTG